MQIARDQNISCLFIQARKLQFGEKQETLLREIRIFKKEPFFLKSNFIG